MSRIGIEIPPLNSQMLSSDHPTQPREEALGEIGVCAITAVCFGMVDPLHVESRIKHIPVRDLVCRYHAAMSYPFTDEVHALGLAQECSGQRPTATLTQNNYDTPLVATVAQQPTVDALVSLVCWPDMSAEHRPIDFDLTLEVNILCLCRHRLAQLVHENECRLVLHIEIPGKLDCRKALRGVHEQANRNQKINKRQLA